TPAAGAKVFVVIGGVRNISAGFSRKVNAKGMTQAERMHILVPVHQPLGGITLVVNDFPEDVKEIGVAGPGNGALKIAGMPGPVRRTAEYTASGMVSACTMDAQAGGDYCVMKRHEGVDGFEGRSLRITGLYSPVEKRFGGVSEELHVVVPEVGPAEHIGRIV